MAEEAGVVRAVVTPLDDGVECCEYSSACDSCTASRKSASSWVSVREWRTEDDEGGDGEATGGSARADGATVATGEMVGIEYVCIKTGAGRLIRSL